MRSRASSCVPWQRCVTPGRRLETDDTIPTYVSSNQEHIMAVAQAEILDQISSMTVPDLAEPSRAREEKCAVSAAAAVWVAAPAGAGAAAPAVEEQTEFTVMLSSFGENKVNV